MDFALKLLFPDIASARVERAEFQTRKMHPKLTLHLCLGAACHQFGGYRLTPQIETIIRRLSGD
jgi:NADH:ubiquinone oxidoreductase subunit E